MTTPARVPGKYGRRKPDLSRPALRLADILTGSVPPHPAAADYLAALGGGWQMLGNDQAGDCSAVAWANGRRLVTATLATEDYPSQAQVWEFYKTQNPDFDPAGSADGSGPGSGADQGMDIQTGLEYLHKTGGPDGVKAVAFAKVNTADAAEVKAAIAIFGSLWTGIDVLAVNEDQFSEDRPWGYSSRSQVAGGHAVLTGGYGHEGGDPALGGDEKFITWAAETSFTDDFWEHQAQECWVVIWPEHLGSREFQQGVSRNALAAAYHGLTGKTLIFPQPQPSAPQEHPHTVLLHELATLVRVIAADSDREIAEAVAWLHSHGL